MSTQEPMLGQRVVTPENGAIGYPIENWDGQLTIESIPWLKAWIDDGCEFETVDYNPEKKPMRGWGGWSTSFIWAQKAGEGKRDVARVATFVGDLNVAEVKALGAEQRSRARPTIRFQRAGKDCDPAIAAYILQLEARVRELEGTQLRISDFTRAVGE